MPESGRAGGCIRPPFRTAVRQRPSFGQPAHGPRGLVRFAAVGRAPRMNGTRRHRGRGMGWRAAAAASVAVIGLLFGAALAVAHIERPAYWPDPKPDRQVSPPAGGRVPTARALSSALDATPSGTTRIVCQSKSLELARRSIRSAETNGYRLRPTTALHRLGKAAGDRLLAL